MLSVAVSHTLHTGDSEPSLPCLMRLDDCRPSPCFLENRKSPHFYKCAACASFQQHLLLRVSSRLHGERYIYSGATSFSYYTLGASLLPENRILWCQTLQHEQYGSGQWALSCNGIKYSPNVRVRPLVVARCAQGGIAHHPIHKVITGFLIGTEHGSEGEFLDARTIITRMGARTARGKGSCFSSSSRYAQKVIDEKRCVGVVIHKNHATLRQQAIQLPSGEAFAILGTWWIITDLWIDWQRNSAKPSTECKVLMAKLELVDETGPCWWMQAMVAPSSSTTAAALAVANTSCATCRQPLLRR